MIGFGLLDLLVAQELNNTPIKLALFRLLFTNKWVTYPDKPVGPPGETPHLLALLDKK